MKVGSVLRKKSGEGSYIKIDADITLAKGTFLQVFDPRKNQRPDRDGKMREIPDYVLFDIVLAPQQSN